MYHLNANIMNYIAYYRVSTDKQGESGLSIESQKNHVRSYIESTGGILAGEFTEVASGGDTSRERLKQAIELAEEINGAIVVKRLDRLTRDGFKVSTLLEDKGIPYIDCESPSDSSLVKNIKLAVAKEEKEKISSRIQNALDVIKENIERDGYHISKSGRKITSLGGDISNLGGEKAQRRSAQTRRRKALNDPNNIRAAAIIKRLYDDGTSFYKITQFLNESGFKTSRGNDFSPVQAKKLYELFNK